MCETLLVHVRPGPPSVSSGVFRFDVREPVRQHLLNVAGRLISKCCGDDADRIIRVWHVRFGVLRGSAEESSEQQGTCEPLYCVRPCEPGDDCAERLPYGCLPVAVGPIVEVLEDAEDCCQKAREGRSCSDCRARSVGCQH